MKLSLFRLRYFSSVANVLTRSPQILHVNERDFFQLNFLSSDRWIWSRFCDWDLNSACTRLPYCLSKGLLRQDFLNIYLTTFHDSVISEIQKLWGSSFFSKYSKFNLDLEKEGNIGEKVFSFWEKYIWIGIVKFSLFRTRSFSSVAGVVTSSPKIWHVNKRDFLEHNIVASDQWIWYRCFQAYFNAAWARFSYCFSKLPMKLDLTTFSESVICNLLVLIPKFENLIYIAEKQ